MPRDAPAEEVARQREVFRRALKLPPEVAGETIVRGVERPMPVSYRELVRRGMGR